jgi:hypothetical protein
MLEVHTKYIYICIYEIPHQSFVNTFLSFCEKEKNVDLHEITMLSCVHVSF